MAIEKVIIQNFKKFKNPFEVKFNENINLLVGDNESGKSTILEAIHVALTGMYAGRNIRNQLSTYLFNREAVEEYLASVKNEQPIAPPEIMIELYFKSGTLPEYEGNGNSEKSDGIEGIRFTISFSDKFNSEYESLLKTEKITSLPIEFYEAKWFSFSRDEKMPRFIPIKSVMIDSSNYRYQNGSDVYISRVVKDFLEPEDITAITQAHVMTVGGVTFKRYLEIAQTLNKETAVVTDNDGNIEAVKKKYKEYEEIQCIHICVDEVVDTGDLKLSDKDFNYNTLEPKILKENGREAMNNIFGTNYDTDDEMHKYMHAHKTDCAIAIFESATKIKYPEYIMRAIKNE